MLIINKKINYLLALLLILAFSANCFAGTFEVLKINNKVQEITSYQSIDNRSILIENILSLDPIFNSFKLHKLTTNKLEKIYAALLEKKNKSLKKEKPKIVLPVRFMEIDTGVDQIEPQGPREFLEFSNSVGHGDQHINRENISFGLKSEHLDNDLWLDEVEGAQGDCAEDDEDCVDITPSNYNYNCLVNDVNDFLGADLATLLRSADYQCLLPLWDFQPAIIELYSVENMNLIASEFVQLSANYDGTNNSGILGVMVFLEVALYHNFYSPEIEITENLNSLILDGLTNLSATGMDNINNFE